MFRNSLWGKELAPRGGFEPLTFRLTAEVVEILNALSCVAYRETRPIFSPSVGLLGLPTRDPLLAKQVGKNTKCFGWCRLHGESTKFPLLKCPEVVPNRYLSG